MSTTYPKHRCRSGVPFHCVVAHRTRTRSAHHRLGFLDDTIFDAKLFSVKKLTRLKSELLGGFGNPEHR